MVTANQPLIVEKPRQAGLLSERVEQDMSEALNEFGSAAAQDQREARVSASATGSPWPACATTDSPASDGADCQTAFRNGLGPPGSNPSALHGRSAPICQKQDSPD